MADYVPNTVQHGLDEATNNSQGWYRVDWLSCYTDFTVE